MADFYFKTNRFQSLLLQIPKSLRIPVTTLLLFIICGLWFITLYKPLQCSYYAALTHHTTLSSLQGVQTKIEKKNKKIKKQIAKKNLLITTLQADVSEQETITRIITHLFSCAHDAHVSIIRHSPAKVESHKLYSSSHFCDELHGSYENLVTFLRLLSEKKVALQLLAIKITKQNSDTLSLILDYCVITIKDNDEIF